MPTLQGAALIVLTVLLIQPRGVPDPFGVGAPLAWTVLCLVATVPALIETMRGGLPSTRLDPFVWLYVACFLIVFPFSLGRYTSAVWVLSLIANVLVYYAALRTTREAPAFIGAILLTIVIGVAVLQIIAIDFHLEQGLLTRIADYDRPQGWSGYPELGFLVCVQLAILIAIARTATRAAPRLAVSLVMIIGVVELVFLFSRMAWVTAGVLFGVGAVVGRPMPRMWKPALGALLLVAAIGVAIAQTATGRSLMNAWTGPNPSAGRLDIWKRTAQMIADHPLAGVGVGNFQAIFEPVYNPYLNEDMRRGGHAHNLWLQQAAESGVVVAAIYVILWVAVVVFAAQRSTGSWIDKAALLVVVAFGVRSMGDFMFFATGGAQGRLHTLMWLVWGVIAGHTAVRRTALAVPAATVQAVSA